MQRNEIEVNAMLYVFGAILVKGFFDSIQPWSVHTPDGIQHVEQKKIDHRLRPMQCYAAELVATGKSRPGLFKVNQASLQKGSDFTVTDNELEEAAKCFYNKMLASTHNETLSNSFKQHLVKKLNHCHSIYTKENVKKLTSLVRKTEIEKAYATLSYRKPGSGHVTINHKLNPFSLAFGNTIKITFYAKHKYTEKHLEQAASNLIRAYEARLCLTQDLGLDSKNRTLSGRK